NAMVNTIATESGKIS
ncbi:hypothetical protein D039_0287B, partial [Vibrio parahaemolyticus EKP-028]